MDDLDFDPEEYPVPDLPAYAQSLGIRFERMDHGLPVLTVDFGKNVEGRPGTFHGGATAGLLENAGYAALRTVLLREGRDPVLKPINITVQYLTAGKQKQTFALARITRLGASSGRGTTSNPSSSRRNSTGTPSCESVIEPSSIRRRVPSSPICMSSISSTSSGWIGPSGSGERVGLGAGLRESAPSMKSFHIRAGRPPPVTLPIGELSSLPTQTPTTSRSSPSPAYPTNKASRESCVVPVFP